MIENDLTAVKKLSAEQIRDDIIIKGGYGMTHLRPYFMKNKKWYYADEEAGVCRLTPEGKKIKKVVESYKEAYAVHRDENGIYDR